MRNVMFHFWPNAVIRGFFKLFTSFIAVILPTFYDAKKKKKNENKKLTST